MFDKMTRVEIYERLKKEAPDKALGHTRSRREVLEKLLDAALKEEAAPKPQARRGRKPKLAVVIDFPVPKLSLEAALKMRHGLDLVEMAGSLIAKSGLPPRQLGALLYLTKGVDADQAALALEGLASLKLDLFKEKSA